MANTDLADINEIYLGYFLAGQKWFDRDAKKQIDAKSKKVTKQAADDQIAKAKAMADAVIVWAKKNGYKGAIIGVWWTARPGSLSEAVGQEVDQRKNPTDILIRFKSGPFKGFLGISAKSTKGSTDIGFKNPGVGTVEKALNINLTDIADEYVKQAIKKFKLSETASKRKTEIRANPKIKEQTEKMGSMALSDMADAMFNKLKKMKNDQLVQYILNYWMDSSTDLFPPYIKVTGMGSKEPYSAKIDDPLKNEKLEYIRKNKIKLEKVGNESIGVSAGSKKILKMRFKYESEKLATSIKLSGDPW